MGMLSLFSGCFIFGLFLPFALSFEGGIKCNQKGKKRLKSQLSLQIKPETDKRKKKETIKHFFPFWLRVYVRVVQQLDNGNKNKNIDKQNSEI